MKQKINPRALACHRIQLLLDEYAGDELEAAPRMDVETHLEQCTGCRDELAAITTTRQALSQYPQIKASADFDLRVLEQLALQSAATGSIFDRLDAIFSRPLYKIIGSATLSLVLGLLTLALVVGPQSLLEDVFSPRAEGEAAPQSLRAAGFDDVDPDRLYAFGGLSRAPWSNPEPAPSMPRLPQVPQGGEPAWEPSKSPAPRESDFSYAAPSGSSC